MTEKISEAIKNRNLLEFTYDGLHRIVEPHTIGISNTGKTSLAAYQTKGDSSRGNVPDWGQFTVPKIENLKVLDDTFTGTRPGYTKNDSRMKIIIEEL